MSILLSIPFILAMSLAPAPDKPKPPPVDYEQMRQDFVLETARIEIPGHPHAFNPSIICWNGGLLMTFRTIPDPKQSYVSYIGYIWLDDAFRPMGEAKLIDLRNDGSSGPSRAEDARLITAGNRLYIVYSDNPDMIISGGGFRVYIAELMQVGDTLEVVSKDKLVKYEGEDRSLREKNWVPFEYKGNLLLAYSIQPHKIFLPLLDRGECETIAVTEPVLDWNWGIIRGGTPALLVDDRSYLSFFHSSMRCASVHSNGFDITHYFIGAYLYSAEPPFSVTHISPEPIVGPNFYNGISYKHYWKPVKAIFPCGYIMDDTSIWIAYGRDDHELWIVKLDKAGLLHSLIPCGAAGENEVIGD